MVSRTQKEKRKIKGIRIRIKKQLINRKELRKFIKN